jgi:hypothetical protein
MSHTCSEQYDTSALYYARPARSLVNFRKQPRKTRRFTTREAQYWRRRTRAFKPQPSTSTVLACASKQCISEASLPAAAAASLCTRCPLVKKKRGEETGGRGGEFSSVFQRLLYQPLSQSLCVLGVLPQRLCVLGVRTPALRVTTQLKERIRLKTAYSSSLRPRILVT